MHPRPIPRRLIAALAATAAVLAAAPAAPAATTEFPLPASNAFPTGIAAGPDGNLWVAEYAADRLARVSPDGTIAELDPLPSPGSGPVGVTAGPDGAIWFTEAGANKIGRVTPDGSVTEFGGLSSDYSDTSAVPAGPQSIAAGADGNLWFTEPGANMIGRMTPVGALTEWPLPSGGQPRSIAAGPDGALWFTEYAGNRIGRIATDGGITEYALPTPDSRPLGIAAGPDGRLWFTEYQGNRVGAIGVDGAIAELRQLEQPDSRPVGIAAAPDGAMWFTEEGGNRLGRATTDGVITESPPLPRDHSLPNRIVAGPDGNMWFTESNAGAVARATLDVPPLVTTGAASAITAGSATLTGTVNPSRSPTTFWFLDRLQRQPQVRVDGIEVAHVERVKCLALPGLRANREPGAVGIVDAALGRLDADRELQRRLVAARGARQGLRVERGHHRRAPIVHPAPTRVANTAPLGRLVEIGSPSGQRGRPPVACPTPLRGALLDYNGDRRVVVEVPFKRPPELALEFARNHAINHPQTPLPCSRVPASDAAKYHTVVTLKRPCQ